MKLFLLLLGLLSTPVLASELRPFTSDGCSSFPDGTLKHKDLWIECCTAHDYAYWKGGTYTEREDADKELRRCISAVGNPEIALLMLAGVRIGGTPYLPTMFRWGYGWPYPRGYTALSNDDISQINALTP